MNAKCARVWRLASWAYVGVAVGSALGAAAFMDPSAAAAFVVAAGCGLVCDAMAEREEGAR